MAANLNWLDVAAILIVAAFALDGLLKGFILSVFNMLGFFIAIYAGKIVAPLVSSYISDNTGIDESIKEYLTDKAGVLDAVPASVLHIGEGSGLQVSAVLTWVLLTVICFIAVFLAVRLALYMIAAALDMAARLPVLKQFNKMGGLIFGVVKGVVVLYIIFAILTPILPLLMPGNPLVQAVSQSLFAANFYKYNIIIPWLMGHI